MFDFLGDIAKGVGEVVGTVTGLVVGIPLNVVAETLGLTKVMVKEALDAGCRTYEEIRNFHK